MKNWKWSISSLVFLISFLILFVGVQTNVFSEEKWKENRIDEKAEEDKDRQQMEVGGQKSEFVLKSVALRAAPVSVSTIAELRAAVKVTDAEVHLGADLDLGNERNIDVANGVVLSGKNLTTGVIHSYTYSTGMDIKNVGLMSSSLNLLSSGTITVEDITINGSGIYGVITDKAGPLLEGTNQVYNNVTFNGVNAQPFYNPRGTVTIGGKSSFTQAVKVDGTEKQAQEFAEIPKLFFSDNAEVQISSIANIATTNFIYNPTEDTEIKVGMNADVRINTKQPLINLALLQPFTLTVESGGKLDLDLASMGGTNTFFNQNGINFTGVVLFDVKENATFNYQANSALNLRGAIGSINFGKNAQGKWSNFGEGSLLASANPAYKINLKEVNDVVFSSKQESVFDFQSNLLGNIEFTQQTVNLLSADKAAVDPAIWSMGWGMNSATLNQRENAGSVVKSVDSNFGGEYPTFSNNLRKIQFTAEDITPPIIRGQLNELPVNGKLDDSDIPKFATAIDNSGAPTFLTWKVPQTIDTTQVGVQRGIIQATDASDNLAETSVPIFITDVQTAWLRDSLDSLKGKMIRASDFETRANSFSNGNTNEKILELAHYQGFDETGEDQLTLPTITSTLGDNPLPGKYPITIDYHGVKREITATITDLTQFINVSIPKKMLFGTTKVNFNETIFSPTYLVKNNSSESLQMSLDSFSEKGNSKLQLLTAAEVGQADLGQAHLQLKLAGKSPIVIQPGMPSQILSSFSGNEEQELRFSGSYYGGPESLIAPQYSMVFGFKIT